MVKKSCGEFLINEKQILNVDITFFCIFSALKTPLFNVHEIKT